jgi:hypothetical protein
VKTKTKKNRNIQQPAGEIRAPGVLACAISCLLLASLVVGGADEAAQTHVRRV